jgi:hypothetical protein
MAAMSTLLATDPKELMGRHLLALKEYARRVFDRGETLTALEEDDRGERLREFMAIGRSFRLTAREMVGLVYRDTFAGKRGCGCPRCPAKG